MRLVSIFLALLLASSAIAATHPPMMGGMMSRVPNCADGQFITKKDGTYSCEEAPASRTGAAGPKGDQGDPGPMGPEGPAGQDGPAGSKGATGAQGASGPVGRDGLDGTPGPRGFQGDDGAPGPVGPQGPAGAAGPAGPKGDAGAAGAVGPKGDPGATGSQGPPGATGAQGPAGTAGATGATGPQGQQGVAGATGATGPAGQIGQTGPGATLVGTITVGETALILLTAGQRQVTNVTLNGATVGDVLLPVMTTVPPAGYAVDQVVVTATNKVTVLLQAPALAIGASYSIPVRVYRLP